MFLVIHGTHAGSAGAGALNGTETINNFGTFASVAPGGSLAGLEVFNNANLAPNGAIRSFNTDLSLRGAITIQ